MPKRKRQKRSRPKKKKSLPPPPPVDKKESWEMDHHVKTPHIDDPPKPGPVVHGRPDEYKQRFKSILSVLSLFFTTEMINETNNRPSASSAAPIQIDPLDSAAKTDDDSDPPGRTKTPSAFEKEEESDD